MQDIYVLVSEISAEWVKTAEQYADKANIVFITRAELKESGCSARYLITTGLSKEELAKLPDLKTVCAPKTGTDGFPAALMLEKDIKLISSHANAFYVAEHAVALAFSLLRNIALLNQKFRNSEDTMTFTGMKTMKNMTVGIMGYGNIGSTIAEMLKPYDVTVAAYSHTLPEGVIRCETIKELFEKADIVFNCLPLTDKTEGLVKYDELILFKDKYLVNVSRAEIIGEEDLFRILKENVLAGYAADVWYKGDYRFGNHEYEQFDKVIITPHCGPNVEGGRLRYMEDALNKCLAEMEADER